MSTKLWNLIRTGFPILFLMFYMSKLLRIKNFTSNPVASLEYSAFLDISNRGLFVDKGFNFAGYSIRVQMNNLLYWQEAKKGNERSPNEVTSASRCSTSVCACQQLYRPTENIFKGTAHLWCLRLPSFLP